MAAKTISTQIEKFFEDRLKAITKDLEYSDEDIKALLEANKKMSSSPRARKTRDPNAPKPPNNGYILYCTEMRPKIKEANPDMKGPEIMKMLGAQWKAESDSVKNQYKAQYQQAKTQYDLDMKAYEGDSQEGDGQEEAEASKTKEATAKKATAKRATAKKAASKKTPPKKKEAKEEGEKEDGEKDGEKEEGEKEEGEKEGEKEEKPQMPVMPKLPKLPSLTKAK